MSELNVRKNEEEAVSKAATTSYRMRPSLAETFKVTRIREMIQDILSEKLHGKSYTPEEAGRLTRDISDTVNMAMSDIICLPRYKHVVQVTLGQQTGAGCRYIAKCCWDAEADSYASESYFTANLFCICTVFGIYLY